MGKKISLINIQGAPALGKECEVLFCGVRLYSQQERQLYQAAIVESSKIQPNT